MNPMSPTLIYEPQHPSTSHRWEPSNVWRNHWHLQQVLLSGTKSTKLYCNNCFFPFQSRLNFLLLFPLCLSPGGLCLWLILWLVVVKPGRVGACPRLCVCYPTPMTVSCQSQNLTIVPAGVPYDSQRVFLQNNRITELRADSFGFETQVKKKTVCNFHLLNYSVFFPPSHYFLVILCRCFGYMATTSHGSRLEPSVIWGCWRSSIWAIIHCSAWKVVHSGVWRSCRACTCIAASWLLSPTTSSTNCTACNFSTCR